MAERRTAIQLTKPRTKRINTPAIQNSTTAAGLRIWLK
jgi:hypothetical protein